MLKKYWLPFLAGLAVTAWALHSIPAVLAQAVPDTGPVMDLRRDVTVPDLRKDDAILYSSCFYLSVAGAGGALCAWAIIEPFMDDQAAARGDQNPVTFFVFPTVAAFIGLFLGAVEGLMCRNLSRALISAVVGLAIGFGAGLISLFVAGIIFVIMAVIAFRIHLLLTQRKTHETREHRRENTDRGAVGVPAFRSRSYGTRQAISSPNKANHASQRTG